ncbi:MAG: hypothetical protein IBX68_10840 [Dehalococcoidia bacterium]|nr:hypothetical protein [Dehalococcoidia bacterium]
MIAMLKRDIIGMLLVVLIAVPMLAGMTACGGPPNAAQDSDEVWRSETGVSWARAYGGFEDLGGSADLIVLGTVGKAIAEEEAFEGVYFTVFSFDVHEVLKGKEVQVILIDQTGAVGKQELRDDPLLYPGDRYILFLREWEPDRYFVLGGPQGRFRVIDERVYSMNRILGENIIPLALDIDGWQEKDFLSLIVSGGEKAS